MIQLFIKCYQILPGPYRGVGFILISFVFVVRELIWVSHSQDTQSLVMTFLLHCLASKLRSYQSYLFRTRFVVSARLFNRLLKFRSEFRSTCHILWGDVILWHPDWLTVNKFVWVKSGAISILTKTGKGPKLKRMQAPTFKRPICSKCE